MGATLSGSELMRRIQAGAIVVDVMTPEEYAICHVTGAQNACIYEMVFLERMAELVPDHGTELVLYDATGTTRAAEVAREKLLQAGYSKVSVLSGGLAAWRAAGLPVESVGQTAVGEPELQDGTYRIDTENSTLEWIGRNFTKRHYGRIAIKNGDLIISGGKPVAGEIVLDMTAISNLDLQDGIWRDMLIRHLKSDDFFSVERFPTASFKLTGWETQDVDSSKALKGIFTGELTIKGTTRSVGFPASVAPIREDGIQAHALFEIDRTLWEVGYGSSRFFERLGMHFVHDLITLELFLVART